MNELTIFKLTSLQLLQHLKDTLINYGYSVEQNELYLFCSIKSCLPVLLNAHVDTVHQHNPKTIYHDKHHQVLWSPEGLGADDRAGVIGILNLLHRGYRPLVLFTDGEESGGLGAYALLQHYPELTKHNKFKFIITLDRMGSNDAVYYNCANKRFKDYITQFGFKTATGSFSDISILCPEWNIAGVNLSIGYYNQHTLQEYLKLNELETTLRKVENIIQNLPSESFKYVPQISPNNLTKFKYSAMSDYLLEEDCDNPIINSMWDEPLDDSLIDECLINLPYTISEIVLKYGRTPDYWYDHILENWEHYQKLLTTHLHKLINESGIKHDKR